MELLGLLGQVESLITRMPTEVQLFDRSNASAEWRGQVNAVLAACGSSFESRLALAWISADSFAARESSRGYGVVKALIYEARHHLSMQLGEAADETIGAGAPFDYLAAVIKRVSMASTEVFFADPYLDAHFVIRYFPHIKPGVEIRLLTEKRADAVKSAVEAHVTQHGTKVQLRRAEFHDRYIFIDGQIGYTSGVSFKDGGVNDHTAIVEMRTTFASNKAEYERLWDTGTAIFP